jgi:tetratricopeptide (TPR) repeat protein
MTRLAIAGVLLLATAQAASGQSAAYVAAYNLNYDEALRLGRLDVAARPDDPEAHRTLATIVWMHILFTRGGITIDHYLGGLTSSQIKLPPPPAAMDAEFRLHVGRALALADAGVARNPRDAAARYDSGAAQGLMASYIASVEGKVRQAFGSAKGAFDSHEWVLAHDPTRQEAGLVVGTYRYAVAALSMPKRLLAYIAGFGGGRELGLKLIEAAAAKPVTRADSRVALALMHSREGRHADAVSVLKLLAAEFPQNRLLQLEIGAAAWRAGRAAESDAVLTAGLAWHDRDARPKVPGERALWLYKRGMARVSQNRLEAAVMDLRAALTSNPLGWVRGRVHLELGKVADLRAQRSAAMTEYTTADNLCRTHQDPWCVETARRYLKQPFQFTGPARPGFPVD